VGGVQGAPPPPPDPIYLVFLALQFQTALKLLPKTN
jgi:hypothetical protein